MTRNFIKNLFMTFFLMILSLTKGGHYGDGDYVILQVTQATVSNKKCSNNIK